MKEELANLLYDRYPLIFAKKIGIECGDGWYNIIHALCHSIQTHIDNVARQKEWAIKKNAQPVKSGIDLDNKPCDIPDLVVQVNVQQIKEKFGTLRFYASGGNTTTSGMISMADALSEMTCEECGAPGKRRQGSWIRTLCDQHHTAQSLGAPSDFLKA